MTEVATRPAVSGPGESDWSAAVAAIRELAPTGRVLLACHVNPDGDALGSMLGCALGLRRLIDSGALGESQSGAVAGLQSGAVEGIESAGVGGIESAGVGGIEAVEVGGIEPAAVGEVPPAAMGEIPPAVVGEIQPAAVGEIQSDAVGRSPLGSSGPALQATFPGDFEVPEPFTQLPGIDLLVPEDRAFRDPDLVMVFDVAAESRLGGLADRLSAARETIVLDHHASNTGFGGINLVDPQAAATSVVAEELLARLDVPLDAEIAECLYVALATDTGSFRFDTTTPRVHEMAARLIATGIRPGAISRRVFDTRPFGAMKLFAEVLARAALDPTAAGGNGMVWTYATLDDLRRHGQRPYVMDALIDPVRTVAEADVAVLVKQIADQEWAVSLRSKGAVDVSQVAIAMGGGGHRLAAGFTGHGTPGEVVVAVRGQLDRFLT